MNSTGIAKRGSTIRKIGWLTVGSMLAMALLAPAAPVLGIEGGNPPNVECAGYDFYFKIDSGALEAKTYTAADAPLVVTNWTGQTITISNLANGGQTFDWTAASPVSLVVTKEGADEFSAVYDPAATTGSVTDHIQQGLSHITFCGDPTTTTTTTSTSTTSTSTSTTTTSSTTTSSTTSSTTTVATTPAPSQQVLSETSAPSTTLPPTDTFAGEASAQPSGSAMRLMLIAMAGLLAAVMVLTPAKVGNRR